MQCPSCSTELKLADRQGVEIDYCPKCRGVWLDRGELDKIIERLVGEQASFDSRRPRHREHFDDDYYKYKKRKSWISEIFDF